MNLENYKDLLNSYIYETAITKERKLELVRNFSLQRIYVNEFSLVDKLEFIKIKVDIFKQKSFNKILFNYLKDLIILLDKNKIDYVVLKGIPLAHEIYEQPEIRKTSDIDILINKSDFEEVITIVKKLGYSFFDSNPIKEEDITAYLNSPFSGLHFEPIINNNIILEIHTKIINRESFNEIHTEKFIKDVIEEKEKIIIEGLNVSILNYYDNILFLASHFIKHMFEPVLNGFLYGNVMADINLALLLDIALLIEHVKPNINFDILYTKARKWKIYNEFNLVINILNEIFAMKIKYYEYDEFNKKNLIDQMIRYEISDNIKKFLLAEKNYKYWKNRIKEFRKNFDTIECTYANEVEKNFFYSKTLVNILDNSKQCHRNVDFKSKWSEKYFIFNIIVYNNIPIFGSVEEDIKQDTLRICLDNKIEDINSSWVRSIMIEPRWREGELGLKVYEDIFVDAGSIYVDLDWEEKDYYYNVDIKYKNGYNIEIGFKWEKLNINPINRLEIGFDIVLYEAVWNSLKDETIIEKIFSWSNPQIAWYDVSSYERLILTRNIKK